MGDGPPGFRRSFSCSAVLRILLGVVSISSTGLSPSLAEFSKSFNYTNRLPYWSPTTPTSKLVGLGSSRFARRYSGNRISFYSCNYLDVSVHCVFLLIAMYSQTSKYPLRYLGSPIRKSLDHSLLTAPQSISVLVPSFIGS